jgi:tRNA pseudouridine55 synthase
VNGWICLDKPSGISSNLAMVKVRKMLGRNTGYVGTLDPFATGVLPIAVGEARKFIRYVEDGEKEYVFTALFGVATDTLDRDGRITATTSKIPDKNDVAAIIAEFCGEIEQTPPVFSAIKVGGRRACDMARAGKDPKLPSRKIQIHSLRILEDNMRHREMTIAVSCSRGTYIRRLATDMAERLGSLCHLKELRRIKSGFFSIDDSIPLEKLMKIVDTDRTVGVLVPTEGPLGCVPSLSLDRDQLVRLGNGLEVDALSPSGSPSLVRLLWGKSGAFCGVGVVSGEGRLRLSRMFLAGWEL